MTIPKTPFRRQHKGRSPRSAGTPVADRSLVAELIARRPSTLMQIYDDHAAPVYAMSLRMVGKVDAAEHMVEKAFLALWRSPERVLSEGQGIRSFLFCEAVLGGSDGHLGRTT
jgi:hypothetical protein